MQIKSNWYRKSKQKYTFVETKKKKKILKKLLHLERERERESQWT